MAPSGEWGVYVKNLETGVTAAFRQDQRLHPASTIKVAIAIDFLDWFDHHPGVKMTGGPVPRQRSFAQLLEAMMVKSEEDAAASLTEFLQAQAGYDPNSRVLLWGATHTTVVPRRSTAEDLALLLERLYRGELVSPTSTRTLLELMRTPTPSQSLRIGGGLPPWARAGLAHTTGTTFEEGWGAVGDIGVVEVRGTAYVIVAIGNHVRWVDYETSMQLISEISSAAFRVFVGIPEDSARPPAKNGLVP
jgi:hypothetical protein